MAIPVLIYGKSGSGKSRSMKNCVNNDEWNLIRVLDKPLPFRGNINGWKTDDYQTVMKCLVASKAHNIVIDDAGYLIVNMFMKGHGKYGSGNAIFGFYNELGDSFWNLLDFIANKLPKDKIVFLTMHEEKNEFGDVKAKTIGKLLDDKVCIEGLFTIVLHCGMDNGEHVFFTQSSEGSIAKSPEGMFENLTIPNDLAEVEKSIREYWEIPIKGVEKDGN